MAHRPKIRRIAAAVAVLLLAASMSLTGPTVAASGGVSLSVPSIKQSQSQWCWAASTQSAVKYLFGITYTQCQQANARFNRSDCCTYPSSSNCNKPSALADVGNYLHAEKAIDSTHEWWALSWSQTTGEIGTQHRPFLIRIGWSGGGGHIIVGRGYSWHDGGTDQFSTMDPGSATYKWYSWSYFKNNSSFTWTNTLWKIHQ